jgi:lysophospholipase L1-like esterase
MSFHPSKSPILTACAAGLLLSFGPSAASAADLYQFHFGPGAAPPGYLQVLPTTAYSDATGYGFEPGAKLTAVERNAGDALQNHFVTSQAPFYFSFKVPGDGNYRIRVTLGDVEGESTTTIKAELRRLMVERLRTAPHQVVTAEFVVNVRTPQIAAANGIKPGVVNLKAPRESIKEGWAWDKRVTLEFNPGPAPGCVCLCDLEVEPVDVPTIFVLGDSTVCDQSGEPFASWGQMLPRFFNSEVAVANHGESGETYRSAIERRRLDKILSVMKPGDTVIMQFGHNDQKEIAQHTGGPFTTYKAEIKHCVDAIRALGGIPVIVSPMERRFFTEDGKVRPTLADYAEAARQSAHELGVAFIDLNAISIPFYETMGPDGAYLAFAGTGPVRDTTHTDNYGAYEFAKAIVQGIRDDHLEIARYTVSDFGGFDPRRPDRAERLAVPPSPSATTERPFGS